MPGCVPAHLETEIEMYWVIDLTNPKCRYPVLPAEESKEAYTPTLFGPDHTILLFSQIALDHSLDQWTKTDSKRGRGWDETNRCLLCLQRDNMFCSNTIMIIKVETKHSEPRHSFSPFK